MNRKILLDHLASRPFGSRLNPEQSDGVMAIVDAWERDHRTSIPLSSLAYMLAHTHHDTNGTMKKAGNDAYYFVQARKVVAGSDQAEKIAARTADFLAALTAAAA